MSASELARDADKPMPPAGPDTQGWSLEQVLNPDGETFGLVVVRHTTGFEFDVDRAVYAAENGEHAKHGGWYIDPDKDVRCEGCDAPLFTLISVTGNPKDAGPGLAVVEDIPVHEARAA